ncbi:hypothetical protein JXB28_03035 [Candidatus Woesearchaeota archaeon]|nr:hypothetical protein [Candidatus Woesearchaeota archaeon]
MAKFKFGPWAFIIGLLLAIIFAFLGTSGAWEQWAVLILALLGLLVGILNVTGKESHGFLLATIAFMLTFGAFASVVETLGIPVLVSFFKLMQVFIAPAAFIVAIKALFGIVRD